MEQKTIVGLALALGLGVSVASAQDFCSATHSGTGKTVTFNLSAGSDHGDIAQNGDYHYEQWSKSGSGSATFYTDGSFSCSFSKADDYLCRQGLYYGSNSGKDPLSVGHLYADFSISSFKNTGSISYAYAGVYGWMQNSLIEWYIVDNWGPASRPTWLGTSKGTITVDGATYTVYTASANRANIEGSGAFSQIYSLRETSRSCGSIDITAHFEAWKKLGISLGSSLYEAKILGEAGQYPENQGASGNIDFNYAKVYVSNGTTASSSSTVASSSSVKSSSSSAVASSSSVKSSSSSAVASSSSVKSSSSVQAEERAAYSSNAIPGTIEFENYDKGGQGVAYNDSDDENEGESYRTDGVDVIGTSTGYGVGYTTSSEWLEYTVTVTTAGAYDFEISASNGTASANGLVLSIDGVEVATASIPNVEDDWNTYSTVTGTTTALTAGSHVLRVSFSDSYSNIDYVKFTPLGSSSIASGNLRLVNSGRTFQVFDMQGKFVGKMDVAAGSSLESALRAQFGHAGVYLVKQGSQMQKVSVK